MGAGQGVSSSSTESLGAECIYKYCCSWVPSRLSYRERFIKVVEGPRLSFILTMGCAVAFQLPPWGIEENVRFPADHHPLDGNDYCAHFPGLLPLEFMLPKPGFWFQRENLLIMIIIATVSLLTAALVPQERKQENHR